jgi:hypothetical protein
MTVVRSGDPEERVYRRVVLTLSLASSRALDEVARFNQRDRRREALRLLSDAIANEDRIRRAVADQPTTPASGPRSVEARRRAAATRELRVRGRAR